MSQQTPYIGCKISLISMLDIRYEGILHSVNSEKSTIALSKVRSFGTEDRPTVHAVPSRDEVYEYIIFKATDIKDLVVCSSTGPDYDPAIISVSSLPDPLQEQKQSEKKDDVGAVPPPPQQQQWNAVGGSGGPVSVAPSQQPPATRPNGGFGLGRRGAPMSSAGTGGAPSAPADNSDAGPGGARNVPARSGNYHSNNHYGGVQQQHHQRSVRGPPRAYQPQHQPSNDHQQQPPHYHQYHHHHNPAHHGGGSVGMNQLAAAADPRLKFDSDFDFEEANEKFKEQLGAVVNGMANANIDDNAVSLEEIERSAIPSPPSENVGETFYNKKTSFFDNISCESLEKTEGKNTRPDWKKERMTNQETFGHSAVRSLTYQRRGSRGFVGGGAHGYHRHQNQNHFNNYNSGGGGNRNYRNYHQNQQPRHHQHYGGGHGGGQQQYGSPSGDGGGAYHQNSRAYGGGGGGRAGPNGNNRGSGW